jgi:hypothetical protein
LYQIMIISLGDYKEHPKVLEKNQERVSCVWR